MNDIERTEVWRGAAPPTSTFSKEGTRPAFYQNPCKRLAVPSAYLLERSLSVNVLVISALAVVAAAEKVTNSQQFVMYCNHNFIDFVCLGVLKNVKQGVALRHC